jgi:hypothetical protein
MSKASILLVGDVQQGKPQENQSLPTLRQIRTAKLEWFSALGPPDK